jgi:D-alanyl-lipoteichoic acid acyltransferase DltB (MBOAT superfamily)
MLFNTLGFAVFFAIFLVCYLPVRHRRVGIYVLLLFSNIFYGWWNWYFLSLLWVTILVDFYISRALGYVQDEALRKRLVVASLVSNFGILGFFKYWNFLVDTAARLIPAAFQLRIADLVLPVGISFYIFQSISYTIDVYRRQQVPLRRLPDFASFVCYFPHLVAGPMMRLHNLWPQIANPAPITPERVCSAAFLFAAGLARKSLGDVLATFHDPIFRSLATARPRSVVVGILSFGMQIYLDFSGYTDMARGLSRLLGIELIVNFRAPYFATSFRDFWRRWHIALSTWLRDYVYISLGGNRDGMAKRLRNLMITMLVGGLWHGAGWNFVIWGALHGLYLCLDTLWGHFWGERLRANRVVDGVTSALGWVVTFVGVNYAWLYFRIPTFEGAMIANRKIVEFFATRAWVSSESSLLQVTAALLILALPVVLFDALELRLEGLPISDHWGLRQAAAFGFLSGVLFLIGFMLAAGQPTQQFIYFQF